MSNLRRKVPPGSNLNLNNLNNNNQRQPKPPPLEITIDSTSSSESDSEPEDQGPPEPKRAREIVNGQEQELNNLTKILSPDVINGENVEVKESDTMNVIPDQDVVMVPMSIEEIVPEAELDVPMEEGQQSVPDNPTLADDIQVEDVTKDSEIDVAGAGPSNGMVTDDERPTCSKYLNSKTITEVTNGETARDSEYETDGDEQGVNEKNDPMTLEHLASALSGFTDNLRKLIKESDLTKVLPKIMEPLNDIKKIKGRTLDYKSISQRVEELKNEMEIKKKPWAAITNVIKVLNDVKKNKTVRTAEQIAQRNAQKVEQLEKALEDIQAKIEQFDEASDFDSEDEENSPYMLCHRLKERYMKYAKRLIELQEPKKVRNNDVLTDRPVQKQLIIERITRYPEVDQAVQNAVNKNKAVWRNALSFGDIHHVIQKVKTQHNLLINEELMKTMAKDLLEYITPRLKYFRWLDLKLALKLADDLKDPADDDPELQRKLEANRKLNRSEAEVFQTFVKKQNEAPPPVRVNESNDESEASDPESLPEDDDEEDSDSDVEECDANGRVIKSDKAIRQKRMENMKKQIKLEKQETDGVVADGDNEDVA